MKAVVIILKTLASFIIYMRIVNTIFISKEQVVCHYVDLIVKVFEKILKLSRVRGEWGWGQGGLNANYGYPRVGSA